MGLEGPDCVPAGSGGMRECASGGGGEALTGEDFGGLFDCCTGVGVDSVCIACATVRSGTAVGSTAGLTGDAVSCAGAGGRFERQDGAEFAPNRDLEGDFTKPRTGTGDLGTTSAGTGEATETGLAGRDGWCGSDKGDLGGSGSGAAGVDFSFLIAAAPLFGRAL